MSTYEEDLIRYESENRQEHARRAAWFSQARFGLFIHYGLFAREGLGEWVQLAEDRTIAEYEQLAAGFAPKPGCTDEWCRLAVEAGAKYAVMTTRHHEGFSLWDSKVNPYNSYRYCGRDLVREFTDSCRKYGLKIGLYSSLMDWHHPDGWRCMNDPEARARFLQYIEDLNVELCSNYGKIDVLWYDMPWPQMNTREWNSVYRNGRLRKLQPDMLINNRSRMPEDFFTPEGSLNMRKEDMDMVIAGSDWEACMTFNGLSWGYMDTDQVRPYNYTPQRIALLMQKCVSGGGNLLLNIGPMADGTVPPDVIQPLTKLGQWLRVNGEAVYGKKLRSHEYKIEFNGISRCTASPDRKNVYLWNYIWPKTGVIQLGGAINAPKRATLLKDGTELGFEHDGHRLRLLDLPAEAPDDILGITVIKLEYDEPCENRYGSYYPQITNGADYSCGLGNP